MSLFDDISRLTGGAGSGGPAQSLLPAVLEMLSNRQGGLAGLASAFQQKGLGDIVSSWIGTGQNLPVSAGQIQQVLGEDEIGAFAQKAGIASEEAAPQLAGLLPGLVDKLTPAVSCRGAI